MKILVVGDTHGNAAWLQNQVIPYAVRQGAEKILQVGDFGFVWDGTSGEKLDALNRQLTRFDIDLHFLPGNHENYDVLEDMEAQAPRSPESHAQLRSRLFYTGKVARWEWNGVVCAAVGGAVSIDRGLRVPGRSWWRQETLTPLEAHWAADFGRVDVLFAHDAPVYHPFDLLPDMDSQAHRERITEVARVLCPKMWFHGHYHSHREYSFYHAAGEARVLGLGCDGADLKVATELLTLAQPSTESCTTVAGA